jgi:predicted extracellular nuclease
MRVLLISLAAALALAAPASAASPDIVISQVYGGGGNSGATLKNDFIELYNRGSEPVAVAGWSVQYASSAGTTWQRTLLSGTIRPGRYYLVQEGQGTGGTQDLPTPNATGTIAMSATSGKVALVTSGTALDGCGAACSSAAGVKDFVGYGAANDAETAPTAGLSNTTAALRNGGGSVDTDNNALDFTVGPPNPRNTPPGATITATDPQDGENDVPLDSDVTVTFSAPAEPTFGITCASSGVHAFVQSGGPTEFTLDPTTDFARGESCTVTVHTDDLDDDFSFTTLGLEGLRIHDIQGAQHRSPYENRVVSGVPGVVTAASTNGIWVQDPQPDADNRTSEGVFLFSPSARPPVGTAVTFSGQVQEFKNSSWGPESLSLTEIFRPTVTAGGPVTPIAPTVVGQGGRVPPNLIIDNDSTGDVDTNPMFDPQQDGIDFHESLEGMLLQFNDAVATGPTNNFGEVSIVADNGRNAGLRTRRGGVIVRPFDFNPERFILDDIIGETPETNTGGRFSGPLVVVADYSFDNFKYYPLADATATSDLQREVTDTPSSKELAIASFNVENLAPSNPPDKFAGLANTLINNLKAPDIVAVEEIQDNDGATNSTITDASVTWNMLIAAIVAAGGPTYEFRDIAPVDDQDGGQPGGNIRQGFLFRTDRGVNFVDRPGGTSTNSTSVFRSRGDAHLTFSPGRIDPGNTAFTTSRKPLAGEFTWKGKPIIVVANHFNSKGGDDPLFGHLQPPTRVTETQRHEQARVVNNFARDLQHADPLGDYVVLGDINDFEFSETMQILQGFQMLDLMFTLPPNERYSYVFEGNSQALDHILVSPALLLPLPEYDSVHVNAEFADQQSDHDPQVARLRP